MSNNSVGIVGAGRMGLAMVKHLVKAGYAVSACDISETDTEYRVQAELPSLKKDDVRHFVLHSAGRRVIEQARRLMDLDEAQVAHSRRVLRHFGNMSSATVVFVLEDVLRTASPTPGDWGLMIALGPGFAAEGALLRW